MNLELSHFSILKQQVRNLEYAYIKQGKGAPVFFLHGFPDHAGSWDRIIQSLSSTYTCIAPFLRGYYPTDIPSDHDYSMASIAEDIHQLALALGYDQYSVVGHDWGASIAYVMANIYPMQVQKVVALNMPHPKFLKPSIQLLIKARHILYFSDKRRAPERLSRNAYKYLEILYNRWSPKLDFSKLKQQMVSCFEKDGRKEAALGYYWRLGREGKASTLIYQKLPTIPSLTLVGRQDGTVDFRQFSKMVKVSCFKVKFHSDAGHFLHREDPDYCIHQLEDFL